MKYKLSIGDWSHDGHNMSEDFIFEVNKDRKEIIEAYKKAVKKSKVALTGNGSKLGKGVVPVCVDYEDSKIEPEQVENLKKIGVDFSNLEEGADLELDDDLYITGQDIAILFMEMVRTQLDGFKYKIVGDNVEYINGHYTDFNENIGYGCFS